MPTWQPKPKRTGFGDFETEYSDLLKLLFPDTKPSGWPRYRKGGSPRNWDVSGDYNYVDPNGYLQMGVYRNLPEFPTGSNVVDIPYTVPFSGRPIVLVQAFETSIYTPWVTWRVRSFRGWLQLSWESGAVLEWATFFWMAYGPGAGILQPGQVIAT